MVSCSNQKGQVPPLEERWSDANVNAVVQLWKFNAAQETRLRQVQHLLSDIHYWKNDPYEVAGYLFDFHDWPPAKIATLFREMVKWRLDNDMDTFCERYTPPPELTYFPAFFLKDLDRDGDPVYICRCGAWNAWDLYQRVGPDAIVEYSQFLQELVGTRNLRGVPEEWKWQTNYYEHHSPTNRRYHQFTFVADMQGLSWAQHLKSPLLNVFGLCSRNGQDYYAGTAKRIIILRAPRLFQMAWSMIKRFVDPQMQELITFTSTSDYLQVWDKYMERKSLPKCMHPTGEGEPMPGYWEHVHMEGGPIPIQLEDKLSMIQRSEDMSVSTTADTEDSVSLPEVPTVSVKSVLLLKGSMADNEKVKIDGGLGYRKSVSFQLEY